MYNTIEDFNLTGEKVIIRCDFNVPIKDGLITDDNRIKESLKTIEYAIKNGAKIILMSHLGKIKEESDLSKNTLEPVASRLSELLDKKVEFVDVTRGEKLESAISELKNGEILLIQNTRYEDLIGKKESNNDPELGKYWASLGDIFINDAFGTSHRSHASNVGIATHLPSGIGYLIEKELSALEPAINSPKRPFTVILGGSKVSDKLAVVKKLSEIADYILIGGGMANTFLHSKGYNMGQSKIELDNGKEGNEKINYVDFCKEIIKKYESKIILPVDMIVSTKFEDIKGTVKLIDSLNTDELALDIGPKTIEKFSEVIKISNQIIWNGPMGVFEFENFSNGTKEICGEVAKNKGITIIGGGDSAAAAIEFGYKELFTHISTGGGASLELLEGKVLPGISIISKKEEYEKQKKLSITN